MTKEKKKSIHTVLLNNKIYNLCKIAQQMDQIDIAKEILAEMKKIWSESKWIPEFHHTEGFLYMKESDLISEEPERERLLKLADGKFSRALNLGKEYGFDERGFNG